MIFVDTSFWVALFNRRDGRRQEASTLWLRHANEALLTTNHVRGETWTLLQRRAGHTAAVDFVQAVTASPRVIVVHVDPALEERAHAWLEQHDERKYSFVDATSFVVMQFERIHDALAFDADFTAAGFREVRA